MENPRIAVIVGRNDLDDQLSATVGRRQELLRHLPTHAENRAISTDLGMRPLMERVLSRREILGT